MLHMYGVPLFIPYPFMLVAINGDDQNEDDQNEDEFHSMPLEEINISDLMRSHAVIIVYCRGN